MDYKEQGVVLVAKENANKKFQSIKFRGRNDWFSNWYDKNKPLKQGDIIEFNFDTSKDGRFRNILNYEHAKANVVQEQQKKAFTQASEIPPIDALKDLHEIIEDGAKILNACKEKVPAIFNTEELKPEHMPCVSTLFIYATKELYFRNRDNHQ